MHEHDRSYRFLFAQPRMVEDLVREFVPEAWVERLDFSTLERVNASYVFKRLKRREGDMVWKLRRRDGASVYVYVLLEFQSSVDRFMAVRMMAYVALLYQDLRARGELTPEGLLPLVLPLVVYNGDKRWWAPRELSELIEQVEPGAEAYVPRLRYRVIDKGDYDSKDLERRRSLTALLLWLEKNRTPQALKRVVPRLAAMLERTEDLPLRQAFMAWFHLMLDPEETRAVPELSDFKEFREMLQDTIERWRQQLRGQGERAGEAKVLLRQLERKFGPLDSKTRTRVRKAGSRRLLEWADRFVTAECLEDVFRVESAEPQPS